MTKTLLTPFLVIFLILSSSAICVNAKTFRNSQDTELTFYSSSIAVTSQNISTFTSTPISLGMIYGGNRNYLFIASLTENLSLTLDLYLQRDTENVYIELNSINRTWYGNISFSGCCDTILSMLTTSFTIINQVANSSQNEALFRLDFAIYKLPITDYPGYLSSKVKNALGFPIPSKIYTVSLMLTLIGIIPETIVIKLLLKVTRKQPK